MTKFQIKAIVLSGDGINCESETGHALTLAGFTPELVHVSRLLHDPGLLKDAYLLVLPGGFSFGDEIESGKVLAIKLMEKVEKEINQFIESGKLVIGICNGFQALVQMGLLPGTENNKKSVSLLRNQSKKFINRCVTLEKSTSNNDFFKGCDRIELPIRHGEGKLAISDTMKEKIDQFSALTYCEDVNGSYNKIAALTSKNGNVLGMMPHPEAFVRWTHHPNWTLLKIEKPALFDDQSREYEVPHGLRILLNARNMAEKLKS